MTRAVRHNRFCDPAVADCLLDVVEPEIGLSVIDLGLVYHASLNADGVDVMLTLTTRNSPFGGVIVGNARERLARHFPHTPRISVELVWNPPWNPELITDYGREMLDGRTRKSAERQL